MSQLAAEGLESRQFIFESIPCDHMGLMQSAEEELVIGSSVSYCFLHLTLQEHLAALHWSRMGSEDMVRLVSETSLFPLDTLVRDGIRAGHHWPALYFLSGLTKLTSVLELLNKSLKATDYVGEGDDDDDMYKVLHLLDIDCSSWRNAYCSGKQCNPYFFHMLFETQSPHLIARIFLLYDETIAPSITNPLECLVTAWCVANSDPKMQWMLDFENILILKNFLDHFERLASIKIQYGSVVGMGLNSSQRLIVQKAISSELVHSLSSLFPSLDFFVLGIAPASTAQIVPFLRGVLELISLKTLMINTDDDIADREGELPAAVSIPPLHCPPSLKTIWLGGVAGTPCNLWYHLTPKTGSPL